MWLFFAWRSLRFRMALNFGLLAVIVAPSMQSYIGLVFARHVMQERTGSLQNSARMVAAQLSAQLRQRQHELDFIATLPVTLAASGDARPLRALLSQLKASFRDYAWIGFADPQGRVLVSSDGALEGVDASQRAWFQGDRLSPFIGDLHDALLPGTTLEGAAALAAKLCQKTREQTFKGMGYVTVSIGVAEIDEGDALYEDVVRRADTALYEAKNAGRNRFMVAPPGGTSQGDTAAPTKRQA